MRSVITVFPFEDPKWFIFTHIKWHTLSPRSLLILLRDSGEMSLNPGRDNESDFETHLNTGRQMRPEKMDDVYDD